MLHRPEVLKLFDIQMTYKSDADVRVSYLPHDYAKRLRQRPIRKENLVNAFISSSSDLSKRSHYMEQLLTLMPLHSYGRKFKNRDLLDDKGFQTKMDVISSYKFTLAFENAIGVDYVTEKFFDPLIAGSVPVYLGAPNIEEFAPGEKCYIDIQTFGHMNELVDYLLMLDQNEHLYNEYLSWKCHPFRPSFITMAEELQKHPFLRLCDILEKKYLK
jgi:hypothetical protein